MFIKTLSIPFSYYDKILARYPLVTKSVTSGVLFGAGDYVAQKAIFYSNDSVNRHFQLNYSRILVFCLFGTVVAGPSFHYWLNFLDTLPSRISSSASRFSRRFKFLSYDQQSQNPKFAKFRERMLQILADQIVFSPSYTFVFFVSVGLLEAGLDKMVYDSSNQALIVPCVHHEKENVNDNWIKIWQRTLEGTKDVYLPTYIVDCFFWPPVQLINFTFVPLPYQFLFVNIANLVWNTFLSFMSTRTKQTKSVEATSQVESA